jgi:YidC/Oxa1 family membrane protein insertase
MSEMSDQKRVVIASALSLLVIVAWSMLYRPAAPPPGAASSPAPSSAVPAGAPTAGASTTGATPGAGQPAGLAVAAGAASAAAVSDTAEKTIVVESDLYRVVLSNRGAVVRSWQLKRYNDASRPPRRLDLVHADASQESGNWPFSLQIGDTQIEQSANQALYVVTPGAGASPDTPLTAPAELEFRWSDGQLTVTKRLKFDNSYIVQVESSVQRGGQPVAHRIAWRGGFGDFAAFQAARQVHAFTSLAGSIRVISADGLGLPDQESTPADQPGSFDVVGIEDLYFAAAFLPPEPPPGQPQPAVMTLSGRQLVRTVQVDGEAQQEILPEVAAGSTVAGPLALRVFVGPKDLEVLKSVRPPLGALVQFGRWFGFVAEPLFYVLRWIHQYVPNYGWAIVLLTIAINTILYPLKLRSWRSMQRMQKVAPEVRAIQDRYKKYSMRDPRKAEMNKEVMAIYAREGINPLGSCLPMAAQMPIWIGLYSMLTVSIELRHAPWLGWISDLSGPDPYYILPVIMALLMYAAQKMTPMTITDPAQQRMMNLMPIMFGGMFIFFPTSSGLVLYILTQNVVGIAQQWHLNRTSPLKVPAKRTAK